MRDEETLIFGTRFAGRGTRNIKTVTGIPTSHARA